MQTDLTQAGQVFGPFTSGTQAPRSWDSNPLKGDLTNNNIHKLLRAFELLRIMDREVPGQVVSTFLYIASHNPCHKQKLEQDLGFTTASASRNSDWLSEWHRLRKRGLGLITKERDECNRRRILLRLTPKGEALARQLEEILYS